MSKVATEDTTGYQPVRAPRGTTLSCKGWQQEAAMRMLMNNLDPEVAEKAGRSDRLWRARKSGAQLEVLSRDCCVSQILGKR
jgi:hypothetical protein